jgi:PTS system mannitol-specific IIC component
VVNATEKQMSSGNIRIAVQRLGRLLSGMMMPNIGAFLAWGLLVLWFAPTGWMPNDYIARLIGPMITYLIPVLIGYTGGQMVHGSRGGVIGAVATMGIIVDAELPMLLGAMVVGPLSAFVLKKLDHAVNGKVRPGFEMLASNFTAGIAGCAMMLAAFSGIGPIMEITSRGLAQGVQFLIDAGMLPLVSVLIEPAKILFLNNAINHGILNPIAFGQSALTGHSIVFLLESNPGPGLGVLLAYTVFGSGKQRLAAPGAALVHFFGGIHETYFPFVLMRPRLIIALMAGGAAGTCTFSLLQAGLVTAPSPGSVISLIVLAAKGGTHSVIAGVAVSAAVSFLAAAALLRTGRQDAMELELASEKVAQMKHIAEYNVGYKAEAPAESKPLQKVTKIVFACDAGMGSSAMGASILRKKVNLLELSAIVTNTAINDIPQDADIVITHKSLTDRARDQHPKAEHISIDNFLKSPEYDSLVARLDKKGS